MLSVRALTINVPRLLGIRPGETARIGLMATLLFFLLGANNVIKIVRDSLFLSRFPITQLAYVYLLAALLASGVIGIYSRYTSRLSRRSSVPLPNPSVSPHSIPPWPATRIIPPSGSVTCAG